jgi:hypothetical protein
MHENRKKMKIDKIRIENFKTWNKHKKKVKPQKLYKRNEKKWNKEREIQ